MALKKVEHAAPRKQVMNLDDLEAFVRDARGAGATGSEVVEVEISWGGKMQRVGVAIEMVPTDTVGDQPQDKRPDTAS
ncbi:hypothetical protein AB0C59_25915 [Streptomyces sp. NPDC048664]|uniref:hypothetical protein n=1 Tax=Streptomyces sp. NPDC048664 TaxID=3154505 RepID=UPI00343E0AE6